MIRLVRSATRLLLAATFVAFAADASAQERMICGQPFDGDVTALAERIRQLPHASVSAKRNLLGLEGIRVRPPRFLRVDGAIVTVWDFTSPDHPAHPSVFCSRVVNMGGGRLSRDTQFECQAAKEQCDKLAAELSEREQTINQLFDLYRDGKRLN
jgi:hypothetical protein